LSGTKEDQGTYLTLSAPRGEVFQESSSWKSVSFDEQNVKQQMSKHIFAPNGY